MTIALNKPIGGVLGSVIHTATANASTTTFDFPAPVSADAIYKVRAVIFFMHQTTNHVDTSAGFDAEAGIQFATATGSVPAAATSSTNPMLNGTATYVAAHAQWNNIVNETSPTCTWSVSGANLRLTVVRAGTGGTLDIAVQASYEGYSAS